MGLIFFVKVKKPYDKVEITKNKKFYMREKASMR